MARHPEVIFSMDKASELLVVTSEEDSIQPLATIVISIVVQPMVEYK